MSGSSDGPREEWTGALRTFLEGDHNGKEEADAFRAPCREEPVGHGVKREIQNPAPGTYWVHAATVRATEQSAFTVPVSIVVT